MLHVRAGLRADEGLRNWGSSVDSVAQIDVLGGASGRFKSSCDFRFRGFRSGGTPIICLAWYWTFGGLLGCSGGVRSLSNYQTRNSSDGPHSVIGV